MRPADPGEQTPSTSRNDVITVPARNIVSIINLDVAIASGMRDRKGALVSR